MKIVFLGTNGWYSSPTGDTACILIDSRDHYVIFDAGNGIYKLDQYIKEDRPISLFISHFHVDHISGLQTLHKNKFPQGIDIYVGKNRKKDFETFYNPPYMLGFMTPSFETRIHELSESAQTKPFKMQAIKQEHIFDDHGYRIELEGKSIAYTGDCAVTDATQKLAHNADLLITECANKTKELPGHINPTEAATLAKNEGVKRLMLTHFGPTIYRNLTDRKWAEKEARKIFPDTTAAIDGMDFTI